MSADRFLIKRGATAAVNAYLPLLGEPVFDTTTKSLKIGDGVTLGGVPLTLIASAVRLATARSISATGDITWTTSFDGAGNATGVATLTDTVSAGTYTRVTVDTKGRVTAGQTSALPVANGGTGSTSAPAALLALGAAPTVSPTFTGTPSGPTAPVGTNTTQLATTALVQAEIANKRAWTAYTPTVTPGGGTFTSISATGKYLVVFGVCHVDITITVTTRGTGINPIVTLPFPALAGSQGIGIPARETTQTGKTGVGRINTALTALNTTDYTGSGDLSTADGCVIRIFGPYPIA